MYSVHVQQAGRGQLGARVVHQAHLCRARVRAGRGPHHHPRQAWPVLR